jgi:hypothetical protein
VAYRVGCSTLSEEPRPKPDYKLDGNREAAVLVRAYGRMAL